MATDAREYYRKACLHRFRGGTWKSFWAAHQNQIVQDFPSRKERAALVDRLQCVVLLGIRQDVQPLLDIPGVFRGTELEGRT